MIENQAMLYGVGAECVVGHWDLLLVVANNISDGHENRRERFCVWVWLCIGSLAEGGRQKPELSTPRTR